MRNIPGRKVFGFTLLELMTVVVIVGVLAATALPLLNRYLKRSKTTEATLNLRKIYDGEVAYFSEEHTLSNGEMISKQFVSAAPMPLGTPGPDKRIGNWEALGWPVLKFAPDGPVLYSYSTYVSGVSTTSAFTARAEGDQDGNAKFSLFERVGSVDPVSGEVQGGGAIFELDPIE